MVDRFGPIVLFVRPNKFGLTFGILSLLIGSALILGGPQRSSAPAYAVIAGQGGVYIWGGIFLVIGTAQLFCNSRSSKLLAWLLIAGACAYALLSSAFAVAAFFYPTANFTAIAAYGWIAAMHMCASRKVDKNFRKGIR